MSKIRRIATTCSFFELYCWQTDKQTKARK